MNFARGCARILPFAILLWIAVAIIILKGCT
jgi:hypothetical protein